MVHPRRGVQLVAQTSTRTVFALLFTVLLVTSSVQVPGIATGAKTASSSLTVYAEDEVGARVSGAAVVLYDGDWNHLGTKTTDSDGKVTWSGLSGGTYNLELYNDGAFWGGKSVSLSSGGSKTTAIHRKEPYELQIALTDQGNGDGTYEVGETVTISPEVANDQSFNRDVRVRIYVDSNNDGSADSSVSRGPITISGGSTGWFGWDYTPSSSGTHQVRVEVETDINGNWVLTDDSGWVKSFDVKSNTGDLVVYAEDEHGNRVSGASVVLYDDNWNHIGTKTTDSNGKATWSDLKEGTYNLELYDDGEFWGSDSVSVTAGTTTSSTLRRAEPYNTQIALTDQGDGDGTYEVGETVTISPEVANDRSFSRDVRVTIYLDTDDDGSSEASVNRGPITISGGSTGWFGWDYSLGSSGQHHVRVEVETEVDGKWVLTDDTGWAKSFNVQSNKGSLTVTAKDETGGTVSGASVVLYDDNWNEIGTKTTDSSGQVSWSGLSEGTYNLELYSDGEFWGGASASVTAGSTTSKTITRREPYNTQIDLTDQGDGDGTYEVGETVTISPEVANDQSFSRDVRVNIYVDSNNDGNADSSVSRGPITISGGSTGWFGWDYSPSSSGTHQVRVEVETEVDGSWVLTDDTGWAKQFDVQSSQGGLTVTAEDESGNLVSGASVVLYDANWNQIGTKTTDSNGQVSWSGLGEGTYNLELYDDGEFWTGGSADVTSGSTTTTTLHRVEPYEKQVALTDQGDGDGTYEVGETVTISPEVVNDQSFDRDVRVDIYVDSNNDGSADSSVTRGPLTIPAGSTKWYGWDYTPGSTGTHQVRVEVETEVDGNWVLTDDTGWAKQFEVQSSQGGLTVTATDQDGNLASGASVVLYDDSWNEIGTKTTDSAGQATWSGLGAGTYHLELYSGGEFWTGGSADVAEGSTTSITLRRAEPYENQIDLTDAGDGDGTFEVGETVTISPEVANDQSFDRHVRVTIFIDTNDDGTADDSVTRGPLTVGADSTAWYGWDYSIETNGTHRVRVEVETDIDGSWVLTDETDWSTQFEAVGTGGALQVTATDETGDVVPGATVVLYDEDWNQVGSKTADSSGRASWSGLNEGTYHLELYSASAFWGGDSVSVTAGSTTTVTLHRSEPYVSQLDLADQGDGDGTYEVGETVTISPGVLNDRSYSRDVRVTIYVDSDNDSTADASVIRGPLTVDAGSTAWYGWDYSIDANRTHQIKVEVETEVDGSWVLTDATGWETSFDPRSATELRTGGVTSITNDSAVLEASVSGIPPDSTVTVWFEYRPNNESAWRTTPETTVAASGDLNQTIDELYSGTGYTYRAVLESNGAIQRGNERTFETVNLTAADDSPPTIEDWSATVNPDAYTITVTAVVTDTVSGVDAVQVVWTPTFEWAGAPFDQPAVREMTHTGGNRYEFTLPAGNWDQYPSYNPVAFEREDGDVVEVSVAAVDRAGNENTTETVERHVTAHKTIDPVHVTSFPYEDSHTLLAPEFYGVAEKWHFHAVHGGITTTIDRERISTDTYEVRIRVSSPDNEQIETLLGIPFGSRINVFYNGDDVTVHEVRARVDGGETLTMVGYQAAFDFALLGLSGGGGFASAIGDYITGLAQDEAMGEAIEQFVTFESYPSIEQSGDAKVIQEDFTETGGGPGGLLGTNIHTFDSYTLVLVVETNTTDRTNLTLVENIRGKHGSRFNHGLHARQYAIEIPAAEDQTTSDTSPPSIAIVSNPDPTVVFSNANVRVRVNDSKSGIDPDTLLLTYRQPNGDIRTVRLEHVSGDVYEADLGTISGAGQLTYSITANDRAGNEQIAVGGFDVVPRVTGTDEYVKLEYGKGVYPESSEFKQFVFEEVAGEALSKGTEVTAKYVLDKLGYAASKSAAVALAKLVGLTFSFFQYAEVAGLNTVAQPYVIPVSDAGDPQFSETATIAYGQEVMLALVISYGTEIPQDTATVTISNETGDVVDEFEVPIPNRGPVLGQTVVIYNRSVPFRYGSSPQQGRIDRYTVTVTLHGTESTIGQQSATVRVQGIVATTAQPETVEINTPGFGFVAPIISTFIVIVWLRRRRSQD